MWTTRQSVAPWACAPRAPASPAAACEIFREIVRDIFREVFRERVRHIVTFCSAATTACASSWHHRARLSARNRSRGGAGGMRSGNASPFRETLCDALRPAPGAPGSVFGMLVWYAHLVRRRQPRAIAAGRGGVAGHDDVAGGAEHEADCARHAGGGGVSLAAAPGASQSLAGYFEISRDDCFEISRDISRYFEVFSQSLAGAPAASVVRPRRGAERTGGARVGGAQPGAQLLPDRLERRGTGSRRGVGRPAAAERRGHWAAQRS
eukprot:SAG31_NODE_3359_length_4366_cov_64.369815_1_plen_265_part_00